jgi:hypothetical protein
MVEKKILYGITTIEVLCRNLSVGTEGNHKNSLMIISAPADIRTENIPID